jgi:hypothetical protein
MEQIVYSVAAHRGPNPSFNSTKYMHLLEVRLAGYDALAQSLLGCRSAFIHSDLDSMMQWVEQQSSHCNEIRRIEETLANHVGADITQPPDFLSPTEAGRAKDLLQRTTELKNAVQQINRVYDGMVRQASHNNAVLRNLYATALVYADPRLGPHESYGRVEE